jgi:hypothetical protein
LHEVFCEICGRFFCMPGMFDILEEIDQVLELQQSETLKGQSVQLAAKIPEYMDKTAPAMAELCSEAGKQK